jgi:hypothetical protein
MSDKHLTRGLNIIWLAFLLNILESWYFGWNMEAQSTAEAFADNFCSFLFITGVMYYALPIGIALRACTKAMDKVYEQQVKIEKNESTTTTG